MSIYKRLFFAISFMFFMASAFGQAARSPFTSFGIGEPYGSALINTQGMAGGGGGQPQYWYLNNQNPALLVYNSVNTVFQAGIIYESRTLRADTASEKNIGGNMNYLVTAFPVKPNRWTTSLGLMPYSTVKYRLQYINTVSNSAEKVSVTDEGSGGLTQLYWSNGVRLTKAFTVGVKAAYIFSSIVNTYSNKLIASNQPINYAVTLEDRAYVRDFAFTGGLSFSKDSVLHKKKYRVNAGLVYNMKADLNTRLRTKFYRNLPASGPLMQDTIYEAKSKISIPSGFTAGVSINKGSSWDLGAELSYQNWTNFRNASNKTDALGTSWRVAIGGERTPDLLSESFFKHLTYRLGVSMEQYPYLANNNVVKDRGINFGFSIPAGISTLDVAFRYGKRGNKKENIFEEDYFKIYFGVTFNDRWFVKRRLD